MQLMHRAPTENLRVSALDTAIALADEGCQMIVNDVQVGGKDSRIGLAPVKLNENAQLSRSLNYVIHSLVIRRDRK